MNTWAVVVEKHPHTFQQTADSLRLCDFLLDFVTEYFSSVINGAYSQLHRYENAQY